MIDKDEHNLVTLTLICLGDGFSRCGENIGIWTYYVYNASLFCLFPELAGTYTAVRVVLSVVLILDVLAIILYVFLFRISGSIVQVLSCVDNVTAGKLYYMPRTY